MRDYRSLRAFTHRTFLSLCRETVTNLIYFFIIRLDELLLRVCITVQSSCGYIRVARLGILHVSGLLVPDVSIYNRILKNFPTMKWNAMRNDSLEDGSWNLIQLVQREHAY